MKLKFYDSEYFITFTTYQSTSNRIRLVGNDIPKNISGFEVYDDNDVLLYIHPDYNVIYDFGEDFVEFTNDTNTYYVFYSYKSNMYIDNCYVSTESTMENAILIKEGQGKEYVEAQLEAKLFDDEGFPIYKVVINNENELVLAETTESDKNYINYLQIAQELMMSLENKINELSGMCTSLIVSGIDYKDKHFSYAITDQNNLKSAVELAKATNLNVPYHADGDSCALYSLNDMINIYILNQTNLTHHTTYFNQLKLYIQSLGSKEEIDSVVYGQQLTGEYLENYIMIITQSKKIISAYLGVDETIVDEMLGSSVIFASEL